MNHFPRRFILAVFDLLDLGNNFKEKEIKFESLTHPLIWCNLMKGVKGIKGEGNRVLSLIESQCKK
jgi:hypothetical protein